MGISLRHLLEELLIVTWEIVTRVVSWRNQSTVIISWLLWPRELCKAIITERIFMTLSRVWLILLVLLGVPLFAACIISLQIRFISMIKMITYPCFELFGLKAFPPIYIAEFLFAEIGLPPPTLPLCPLNPIWLLPPML